MSTYFMIIDWSAEFTGAVELPSMSVSKQTDQKSCLFFNWIGICLGAFEK